MLADTLLNSLRKQVSAAVFERGDEYYENGRVVHQTREGNVFELLVRGKYEYAVTLTVEKDRTFSGTCDCPAFDQWGPCKHIVAAGISVTRFPGEIALALKAPTAKQRLDRYLDKLPPEELRSWLRLALKDSPNVLLRMTVVSKGARQHKKTLNRYVNYITSEYPLNLSQDALDQWRAHSQMGVLMVADAVAQNVRGIINFVDRLAVGLNALERHPEVYWRSEEESLRQAVRTLHLQLLPAACEREDNARLEFLKQKEQEGYARKHA